MRKLLAKAGAYVAILPLLTIMPGIVEAQSPCASTGGAMSAPGLYLAPVGCDASNCFKRVDNMGGQTACESGGPCVLNSAYDHYNFVVRTSPAPVNLNSVVVVQQYFSSKEEKRGNKLGRVVVSRDRTPFACHFGIDYRVEYPGSGKYSSVPFDKYENYHRYGATPPDALLLPNEFHIRYNIHPETECHSPGAVEVRTDDPARSRYFLLADRSDYSESRFSFVGRIGSAFWVGPGSANAAESETGAMSQYAQFAVQMTNYKSSVGEAACYTFSVPTHIRATGPAKLTIARVKLVLQDVELLERLRASSGASAVTNAESWNFIVQ